MTNFRPYIPPAALTARMVANTAVVTGWEIRFPSGVLFPEMDPNRMESAVMPTSVAPPLSTPDGVGLAPMDVPAAAGPPAAFLVPPALPAAFGEAEAPAPPRPVPAEALAPVEGPAPTPAVDPPVEAARLPGVETDAPAPASVGAGTPPASGPGAVSVQ